MPKVKVNPDAKARDFVAVIPGEYVMKFERLPAESACKQSEKGNWYTAMHLVHTTPANQLISLQTNQPIDTKVVLPGSVRAMFMMDPERQGTLRQAIEASGQVWPTDANLEIDENWIQDMLDGREVIVRLKTREYQGNWFNEVARFLVQEAPAA